MSSSASASASWTVRMASASATRHSRGRGPPASGAGGGGAAPPQPVAGALVVGDVGERLALPAHERRARVQAEDRRHVGPRCAREAQAVLLGARMRALVRADPAGAVVLDADAA